MGWALQWLCLAAACAAGCADGRAEEATPWYEAVARPPLPESELRALAGRLGGPDFRAREAAEETLKQQPRAVLEILRAYAASEDPEIRMRIRRIAEHLLSDDSQAPQSFLAFSTTVRYREEQWRDVMQPWYEGATVAASNTREDPNSATAGGGMFAQSFVPGCDTIAAVELKINTRPGAWGWLRFQIGEDRDGRPGGPVLAVAWLRVEKAGVLPPTGSPVTGSTYVPFDIPDLSVNPTGTYWMTYLEYPDPGTPPSHIANFTLSRGGYYTQGCHLGAPGREPSPTQDVHFRVVSKCGPVPVLRRATTGEMTRLSGAAMAHAPWMGVRIDDRGSISLP